MHDSKFSLLPAFTPKDLNSALVSLSVASGVVCSKTAFVAVNTNQKASAECTIFSKFVCECVVCDCECLGVAAFAFVRK